VSHVLAGVTGEHREFLDGVLVGTDVNAPAAAAIVVFRPVNRPDVVVSLFAIEIDGRIGGDPDSVLNEGRVDAAPATSIASWMMLRPLVSISATLVPEIDWLTVPVSVCRCTTGAVTVTSCDTEPSTICRSVRTIPFTSTMIPECTADWNPVFSARTE